MTTVLILEDESRAARELAKMLSHIDESIQIVATLDSVEQTMKWMAHNPPPQLIFSDIQLADGLCFEIYTQMDIQSPVIFCTAFDEYLMKAFEANAVSYLLKPITREKVEKALDKFHNLKTVFTQQQEKTRLAGVLHQLKYPYKSALLVHQQEKIVPVQVRDIGFFYLDKTMVRMLTTDGQQYYLSAALEEIENMLDPSIFFRANRQFLVNKSAIVNAERYFARKLIIKLSVKTPETIVVSKARASGFLQWLEGV